MLLQLLAAQAPHLVERAYARGLYRAVQAAMALITGRVPFSVAEASVALGLLVVVMAVARAGRRRRAEGRTAGGTRARRAWAALRAVVATAAIAYGLFLATWGLNHQRPPLGQLAGLAMAGGSRAELQVLSGELVAAANALRQGLPEHGDGTLRLADRRAALDAAGEGLAGAAGRVPTLAGAWSRPKLALLSPLLARLGIAGIFIPFTGEAHVNATLPDADLPFAATHELAHQRGFAREDEANYLAALGCRLHPRPEFRYSGALMSSLYVQAALAREDRAAAAALEATRSAPVRRDLRALAEWAQRYRTPATKVAERVNDAYLKSQGQELGVKSYGAMVDLLLAERRAGPLTP